MIRGVAALAVAWYHLTNMDYQMGTAQQRVGSFGWLGVEAFFVLSGFVIPYSLFASNYRTSRFGSFLVRRIVRIDPPYLLSIVLSMVIAYAAFVTPGYSGGSPDYSAGQVLAHLGYVNNFLGYAQINRVYWTLGIEFQFYILIGLFFALLNRCNLLIIVAILVAGYGMDLGVESTTLDTQFVITHWVPLFLMGIAVASYRQQVLSRKQMLIRLGVCSAWAVIFLTIPMVVTGMATALFIAFLPQLSVAPLNWLGKVSYSLYLVHAPLGERFMNLSHRFVPNLIVCFVLSMALTLLAAWGFNLLIEEPARRWAKGIKRT